MDESAKLSALQKAYAEILMNVSKESASRVMESEKKTLQLQQELSAIKDESLRLLLRLKQMLNDKTNEAETAAISRKRRIDELEAQVGEAEDTVEDLRGELREARAELAKVAINRLISLKRSSFGPGAASTEMVEGNELEAHKNYSDGPHIYPHSQDFPARVMKHKETALQLNSVTQRIQAFGRNLYGQLSLPGKENHLVNRIHGRGKSEELCTTPKRSPDQPFGMEEDPDELEVTETDGDNLQLEVPRSFPRKRKRTARYWKGRAPLCMEMQQASNIYLAKSSVESRQAHRLDLDRVVELLEACRFKDRHKLLMEEPVTRQEKGLEEALIHSGARSDTGRTNNLSSDLEASSLANTVPEDRYNNSKFLKYTFQRRRKKGKSSISDGNSTVDKDTPEMEIDKMHNDSCETDGFDLNGGSSGDTHLMEVAEQLINLSQRT